MTQTMGILIRTKIILSRAIYNIIAEKLRTAGAKACLTGRGPGGSQLGNQLYRTAGGHAATSCRHVSLHVPRSDSVSCS
jgi:hypothetical protein